MFDYDGQLVTIHQSWAARRRHIDSKKGDSDSVDAKSGGGEVETSVAHANVGLGFGASLYPSAVVLADYIYRHPAVVHGKVCVELGAGLGLASIVAVLAGAKRVYVTDGNGELLELTRANVEGNLRDRPHLLDRIHVVEHMWYEHQHARCRTFSDLGWLTKQVCICVCVCVCVCVCACVRGGWPYGRIQSAIIQMPRQLVIDTGVG